MRKKFESPIMEEFMIEDAILWSNEGPGVGGEELGGGDNTGDSDFGNETEKW